MDVIKFVLLVLGYAVAGPALGFLLAGKRAAQRWVLGLLVFMTSWHINKITFMVGSIEWYRGHTKGFECNFLQIVAVGLLVAGAMERRRDFRLVPGWGWFWVAHCVLCTLSVLAAPEKSYVWMAAWKFTSSVLIFSAAWNCVRDDEDLRWLLRAASFTLVVQALVVLKMRYVDGFYQVRGWFEHQNPLAMWGYMLGLPLFSMAMSRISPAETRWAAAGFLASGLIVYGSLSRAALAVFAAGAAMIAGWSLLLDQFSLRRLKTILGMGLAGLLALPFMLDTIIARFNDEGNQASGETRDVMNLASKAMLQDSFVGIGWNNFALTINPPWTYGDVIDDWERDRGHKVDPDYKKGVVESHYWLLLAENGWPGFLGYMAFIGLAQAALFLGWVRHRGTPRGAFLLGIFVAFFLIYMHSTLERVLTQTKNLSAWMILLGAGLRLGACGRKNNPTAYGKHDPRN